MSIMILGIAWMLILFGETDVAELQVDLINQANSYMEDKVFIKAIPLLEESSGYEAEHTTQAEELLKTAYLAINNYDEYEEILEKQMSYLQPRAEVFMEAAEYHFANNDTKDALEVLRNGVEKTGDANITEKYENSRYEYSISADSFEEITTGMNNMIIVKRSGLWGIADSKGNVIIPCEYDKISTFNNVAVVSKDNEIYSVNTANQRNSLLKEEIKDFSYLSQSRLFLLKEEGWVEADTNFNTGKIFFDEVGTYSNDLVPVKLNGKWGMKNKADEMTVEAVYDNIIRDELGRSYFQNAFFVQEANNIYMISEDVKLDTSYEDAKPFFTQNYAAVKNNGKWGFVDNKGNLVIDYQFEDALSFGGHTAAVKTEGMWGYINLQGKIVIEPIFLEVNSFYNGSAPVLTEAGYVIITLKEEL